MTTPFERRRRDEARRKARKRLLVAAAVATPPAVAVAVVFSPLLDVDTVRVVGNKRLPASLIRAAAKVDRGTPLVTLDATAAAHRVERLRAVRRVTVVRSWPSRVTIRVVERVPVVAVRSGAAYDLYDIDGVLVTAGKPLPKDTPPLTVPGTPTPEVVAATVALLRALPPEVRASVRDLRADGAGVLSFRLADGADVVWGGAEREDEKVRALTLLLPQHARRYDVRVPDRPAVLPA